MTAPTAKGETEIVEPTRQQQTAARRAAESKATIPDFTARAEAVVAGEDAPVALLVHAAALALRAHPQVNAAYRDARFERFARVNVAVAAGGALPVVFDADTRSPEEIAAELTRLDGRVREGTITSPELSGATFTVVHADVDELTAVITPPQAAILAAGRAALRPVAVDGAVVARPTVRLALTADARILAPADAAAFLAHVAGTLASG